MLGLTCFGFIFAECSELISKKGVGGTWGSGDRESG